MNAKKLPSGSWRARAFDRTTGKQKSFTAATKKEAEFLATEWLTGRRKDPNALSLDEAIDQYIDSRSNTLSPSTIRGYRTVQANALDGIRELRLDELDELTLQKWANRNAAAYSPKSIRNQFGLLTAVFKQNKIRLDLDAILLKPKVKIEYEVPSPDTMSEIMRLIRGKPAEIPVLIALTCGLRQSEIAALQWSDYDGESLHVHAAVVPGEDQKLVRKEHAKSYAGNRRVDVPGVLRAVLDAARQDSGSISPYKTPGGVLKALQSVCRHAGLPRYKMHALRHAYASLMLREGVADKYAMERLGQSTPSMIKTVYQHTFTEEQTLISRKLDRTFDQLSKSS